VCSSGSAGDGWGYNFDEGKTLKHAGIIHLHELIRKKKEKPSCVLPISELVEKHPWS
jgi:hypothetical protein